MQATIAQAVKNEEDISLVTKLVDSYRSDSSYHKVIVPLLKEDYICDCYSNIYYVDKGTHTFTYKESEKSQCICVQQRASFITKLKSDKTFTLVYLENVLIYQTKNIID